MRMQDRPKRGPGLELELQNKRGIQTLAKRGKDIMPSLPLATAQGIPPYFPPSISFSTCCSALASSPKHANMTSG